MQEKSVYDKSKLVFNEVRPVISIEDNKDKIIIRGNKEKNTDRGEGSPQGARD